MTDGSAITELIDELKTARAQRDEFRAQLEHANREYVLLEAAYIALKSTVIG